MGVNEPTLPPQVPIVPSRMAGAGPPEPRKYGYFNVVSLGKRGLDAAFNLDIERLNAAPASRKTTALTGAPSELTKIAW